MPDTPHTSVVVGLGKCQTSDDDTGIEFATLRHWTPIPSKWSSSMQEITGTASAKGGACYQDLALCCELLIDIDKLLAQAQTWVVCFLSELRRDARNGVIPEPFTTLRAVNVPTTSIAGAGKYIEFAVPVLAELSRVLQHGSALCSVGSNSGHANDSLNVVKMTAKPTDTYWNSVLCTETRAAEDENRVMCRATASCLQDLHKIEAQLACLVDVTQLLQLQLQCDAMKAMAYGIRNPLDVAASARKSKSALERLVNLLVSAVPELELVAKTLRV